MNTTHRLDAQDCGGASAASADAARTKTLRELADLLRRPETWR